MSEKVAVIGGGLGGLSGAIRLARLGFDVQLFEKNAIPGGKMHELSAGNFRFDTGPSLLTMPFVVDELFEYAGYRRSDFLHLEPIEPMCRYFFPDGAVFDASSDENRMIDSIAQLSPVDVDAYRSFMKYSKRIYNRTADIFLFSAVHELRKVLRWRYLPTLLNLYQIDPFRTVHEGVTKFFKNDKLVQIFDRYATYNGSDPFQAPATLNTIPYVEYGLGGFYIKGGMYRLVRVLTKIAVDLGVRIHLSSTVDRIVQRNGRVESVEVDGDEVTADYILCNSDVVVSFDELIDGYSAHKKRLARLEPSLSGLVFFWAVNKTHSELAHHNNFFSADYRAEFGHIFTEHRAPDDPTVYIAITSKKDPEHAPDGCENWFVLLNMPYLTGLQNWDTEKKRMRKTVFDKLKKIGFDIENSIDMEKIYTPEDFNSLFRSNKGSIYGISSNSRDTAFRRPPNRSRQIKGLYFAGGSSHPGGGVPLCLLSGKIASELIADAEGIR
jgi:phytoene desaturase